jgi:hypothetical protein
VRSRPGLTAPALFLLALGCGAPDDSPTGGGGAADVEGTWQGTVTLTQASPSGNCAADTLRASMPLEVPFRMAVDQVGSALAATVTYTASGLTATLTGSIAGDVVSLSLDGEGGCVIGFLCTTTLELRDLCTRTVSFAGTLSGRTVAGTYAETDDTIRTGTTLPAGRMTLAGRFTMRR